MCGRSNIIRRELLTLYVLPGLIGVWPVEYNSAGNYVPIGSVKKNVSCNTQNIRMVNTIRNTLKIFVEKPAALRQT